MNEETTTEENQKGMLCVMSHKGDTRLIWDKHNDDEVEAAETMFDNLKEKGYVAWSVKKDGEKAEVIKKFDKKAEKIIMSPPIAGG